MNKLLFSIDWNDQGNDVQPISIGKITSCVPDLIDTVNHRFGPRHWTRQEYQDGIGYALHTTDDACNNIIIRPIILMNGEYYTE